MTNKALKKLAAEILLLSLQDYKTKVDNREANFREAFAFLTTESIWHEILGLNTESVRLQLEGAGRDENHRAGP